MNMRAGRQEKTVLLGAAAGAIRRMPAGRVGRMRDIWAGYIFVALTMSLVIGLEWWLIHG